MKKITALISLGILPMLLSAQTYRHHDFLGAGHYQEVTVTASSGDENTEKVVDGFLVQDEDQLKDASRFLAQATHGADMATIRMTAAMGYEAWLTEQFQLPWNSIMSQSLRHQSLLEGDETDDIFFGSSMVESAWAHNNITSPDVLRQRMAFIWSQIMVINLNSDLFEDFGTLSAGFYDLLGQNSLDNYNKMLTDVTYSPAMGLFLSHYNNPKAKPELNIHPDENYAREIMQLFSIGLWELNPDGSFKYDGTGNRIPTYTNADIKEFAKVFTGLSDGREDGVFGEQDGEDAVFIVPMKMYEEHHETSEKYLLNGFVLPAGQAGDEDIAQTMQHLSNHPNTAPFICRSLIKFMTTSNPSPTYVQDVASVFNPFAPGNLQAVVSAILLHPEARSCNPTAHYSFGKLREPMMRVMNMMKAFHLSNPENSIYDVYLRCLGNQIGQAPFYAPSVFNFFAPDYQPQGPIGQNYLVAPEFQILNSTNSIGIINDVNERVVNRTYLSENCDLAEGVSTAYDPEVNGETETGIYADTAEALALADNPAALVNYLDILLANGLLEEDTKTIITDAVTQLSDPSERLKMALYLIMISPDYAILK